MATVAASSLSKQEHDELVCSYAALLLHDDGQDINEEKLQKVIKASGNEVESYWPGLFAKALTGQNIGELLTNIGSAGAGAGPAAAADAAPAAKEEDKKKEDEEAGDVDMGGLFGDEEEY
eukprot:NODE_7857_length_435_cov_59.652850_g7000_i0.p1 GENE.NODE_7857_length_435_cov_59.652850_g7000_i0~~NODE_7857_length_435_cov_59.652850_g7000_i0.p1  ORF type:complete len:132 (-),score=52.08 NODE_7857_length_435_cov_59.652850_g7000_i0:40-399(-)